MRLVSFQSRMPICFCTHSYACLIKYVLGMFCEWVCSSDCADIWNSGMVRYTMYILWKSNVQIKSIHSNMCAVLNKHNGICLMFYTFPVHQSQPWYWMCVNVRPIIWSYSISFYKRKKNWQKHMVCHVIRRYFSLSLSIHFFYFFGYSLNVRYISGPFRFSNHLYAIFFIVVHLTTRRQRLCGTYRVPTIIRSTSFVCMWNFASTRNTASHIWLSFTLDICYFSRG